MRGYVVIVRLATNYHCVQGSNQFMYARNGNLLVARAMRRLFFCVVIISDVTRIRRFGTYQLYNRAIQYFSSNMIAMLAYAQLAIVFS